MRRFVAAAVMAAALAFPLGVVANHTFTDVATSSTFHDDIAAIEDAGVTTGCATNLYCPKEFVTREQMAAFLNRLGALGPGKTPVVNADKLDGLDAGQFARSDLARVGYASCSGAELLPANKVFDYTVNGQALYLDSESPAVFHCPMALPDGATVTALGARLRDTTIAGKASCDLLRFGLLATAVTVQMAIVDSSVLGAPGSATVEDLTIDMPGVDNGSYEYVVRCRLDIGLQHTGVHAVSVEYTVSGLP